MATENGTPPATRLFCVWADSDRRVYQHVEAAGPEEAYRIAEESPGDWEFCAEHEDDCYRLSDDVRDLDTDETFTVGGAVHCATCGSEIVATVNDGHFRGGECGGCEYERYRSQPGLLAFAGSARAAFEGLLPALAEERRSVLRGGGTEEDCRDIDERIARYELLIEAGKNAVTGPGGTRLHDSLLPHRMTTNDLTPPAHTPGPWHIDLQSPYSAICIKPYPGEIVCDIEGSDAVAEANARLIAAAPELLRTVRSDRVAFEECIEGLEEEKRELGPGDGEFADQDVIDNYRSLVERCDEVIARATVGAPDDPLRAARSREKAPDDHTPAATTTHPCPRCGKPVEARPDEPAWKSCEPCGIAEDVSWAFGRILVRRYPQAESGDLSPGATFDMDRAVAAAAREWIENNVLPEATDGDGA